MHYPNVHLYTKDWAWKLIIIILPAMYKLLNFQKCNVSHGGIAHNKQLQNCAKCTIVYRMVTNNMICNGKYCTYVVLGEGTT